ncbi:MAG TPA: EamA family transporter [Cyclobacteriaceae bacterium]|nr:EamA family transporter [Cyclobacteriaceae bacterium]
MPVLSHRVKVFLAFSAVYIIWGSTFLGVQVALKSFPPFLLSALRLLIAGLALALFCVWRREPFPPVAELKKHAVCGLVIFVGGVVFVVWAQQFISSSLASAIITTPFWFVILDKPQWKFYFSSKWIVGGLLMSCMGVIILMSFKQGRAGSDSEWMQMFAIITMMIGSGMWVAGALYQKYRPNTVSVYVSTAIQQLSAGAFTLVVSLVTDDFGKFEPANATFAPVFAVVYLALVSTAITFLAFTWLISFKPPAIVSTYAYVNPIVATLLGWLFANEHITLTQLLALGIILLGVFFVNVPRYQALKS